MSDWKNLPPEILDKIFVKLCKRDKGRCSLTCPAWRSVAQPRLFEELHCLTDRDVTRFMTIISNSKLKQSPGDYVKKLYGYMLSERFDVAVLDKLFPFVESIDINYNQQSLYKQLYRLIMEGKFSNLRKMPFIQWDEAYLKLLLAKKEQIKELNLRDSPYNEKVMKKLLDSIHLFSKLSKLQLDCSNEKSTICLENLLPKNISALKKIDFAFKPPAKLTLSASMDLGSIQPLPNVQEVNISDLGLFSNGEESYYYLMKKFPSVNKIYLNTQARVALQVQNYKAPSVACLSEFLYYLTRAKGGFGVRSIITNQTTAKVVEKFLDQALHPKSGTIKKEEFQLHIAFEETEARDERNGNTDCTAYLNLSKTRTVIIDPHRSYRVTNKRTPLKLVYNYTLQNVHNQPYLELFEKVGGMNIEQLMIESNSLSGLTPPELPIPLDIILDHFTNMKKICIQQISNVSFSGLESKSGSTLEDLAFERCNLNPEVFSKISKRCSTLKMLRISDGCRFVNENVLLRIITINMPSIHIHDLCLCISLERTKRRDQQYQRAFIRLRTATKKIRYCKLVYTPPPYWEEEPDYTTEFDTRTGGYTEDDFQMCVKDKNCMIYDIYCESVTKLTVHNAALYSNISECDTKVYPEK